MSLESGVDAIVVRPCLNHRVNIHDPCTSGPHKETSASLLVSHSFHSERGPCVLVPESQVRTASQTDDHGMWNAARYPTLC